MNFTDERLIARGFTVCAPVPQSAGWYKTTPGIPYYRIGVTDGAGGLPVRGDSWRVTISYHPEAATIGESVTVWSRANFDSLAEALDMADLWTEAPIELLRHIQREAVTRHQLPADPPGFGRDPLAELAPELRAWLVDEMGMEAEMTGGGCYVLRHQGPGGWHMWVSGFEGDLPAPDYWGVGVYAPYDPSEAVWYEGHAEGDPIDAPSRLTLRQAVAAACSIMAEAPAEPQRADEVAAEHRARAGDIFRSMASDAFRLSALYEEVPGLNDIQPEGVARVLPMSADEWAHELSAVAAAWSNTGREG
jgi:hypothetical protein